MRSRILEKQAKNIGLKLLTLLGSPHLNKGVTLAVFQLFGNTPLFKDTLNTYLIDS